MFFLLYRWSIQIICPGSEIFIRRYIKMLIAKELEKKLEPGHLMDFLDKKETIWEKF